MNWLRRLSWRFRRRHRFVRLHTVDPTGKKDLTFEGLLVGKRAGHYVLERPRVLETTDDAGDEPPRGTLYEVPVERVWFREVLVKDARL